MIMLGVCIITLLFGVAIHGWRTNITVYFTNVFSQSVISHWDWLALSSLTSGFILALFTVFLYHILTYQSPESQAQEIIGELNAVSARIETLKVALDQVRLIMPATPTIPSASLDLPSLAELEIDT